MDAIPDELDAPKGEGEVFDPNPGVDEAKTDEVWAAVDPKEEGVDVPPKGEGVGVLPKGEGVDVPPNGEEPNVGADEVPKPVVPKP